AATVAGSVRPLTLKPVPAAPIWLIVRLEVPPLLSTIFCELLLPVIMFPKLTLDGFGVSCGSAVGEAPVPVSAIALGELPALLAAVTVPLNVPAAPGAKVIVRLVLCPPATVAGRIVPLT